MVKSSMSSVETTNNEFYNSHADAFDKMPFEDRLPELFLTYAKKLNGKKVLEIGAGGGAFAFWMMQHGFSVTCLEPAKALAEKIRSKSGSLKVYTKTIQEFQTDEKFDSIVAISSLIHISKKELPVQINKIAGFLKPDGFLFVSFIEGDSEGYEDPTGRGKMRYFSKYSEDELNRLFAPYFSILDMHTILVKKMNQSFFLLVLSPNNDIQDYSAQQDV